ncbi:MAG: tetratricopeptide repeat-containing protein [Rhizorhabdus sp.]
MAGDDLTLSNLARIRQVARTGDTLRAWRMFETAGLLASNQPDALSLRGRLLKDRALQADGDQRSALFDQAEAAYLQSAGSRRATYPLINAATIAFFNGKTDQARLLAEKTLALLDSGSHDPETHYWLGATRAEAELLLGHFDAGKATLEAAIAKTPSAWEDHAATLGQLRLILERAGKPAALLDHLRPPASLHFSGLIGLTHDDQSARAAIGAAFNAIRPGFVFGALAAGADIVVAEMAIARGAQLHVVLPTSIASFREQSVARFGADWAVRFDRLIDVAEMVETLADGDTLSEAGITLGEEVAMGLAIRRARTLASEAVALRVRRPADPPFPSETAWRHRGLAFHDVMVERSAARSDQPLAPRIRRAIVASARPLPAGLPLPAGAIGATLAGTAIVQFDSLADAADFAVAALRAAPDNRIGLDYRIVGGEPLDEIAEIAMLLARAAPEASIYAASPGALAMDLHAPHLRFEAAGEIVTPIGDIPVSMLSPSI